MGRKPTDANRLSIQRPDVAATWHPTKNGTLTSRDVSYGSNRKVWWLCEEEHEWGARICSRSRGTGCPYCSGNLVSGANRLSTNHPEIAKEWHPTKNGDVTPYDITRSTPRKVWWQCEAGHEWEATINSRTNLRHPQGCPYCVGKRVSDTNRLSTNYPHVAKEWHPTRNGTLTPDQVSHGSNRKVWWRCEEQHEWDARIIARTRGRGCPFCSGKRVSDLNRLSTNYPKLVLEWHPTRNGALTPDKVSYGSNKKVWWLCKEGHEWDSVIASRADGTGCRYCARNVISDVNRLSIHRPDIAREWHPSKNGELTPNDVAITTNRKAWWYCEEGHEWYALIGSRTSAGRGCPYCAGQRVTDHNRLSLYDPDLAEEWHPSKNADLTPDEVPYGTDKKAWWLCERGHEWEAVVSSRAIARNNCPYCAGQRVSDDNRLSMIAPDLVKEWHPTKNGDLTPDDVSYGTHKKSWWLCVRGHEWEAGISDRYSGNGCRSCKVWGRSKVEIYLACELATFFSDIDPTQTQKITSADGTTLDVDVTIPSENLVIEYDGFYWHEHRLDEDMEKTEALESAGWDVVRIREEPLELLLTTDLHCPVTSPTDIKDLVDSVLIHIEEEFSIDILGLYEYLIRNSLANEDTAKDIIGEELSNRNETERLQLSMNI